MWRPLPPSHGSPSVSDRRHWCSGGQQVEFSEHGSWLESLLCYDQPWGFIHSFIHSWIHSTNIHHSKHSSTHCFRLGDTERKKADTASGLVELPLSGEQAGNKQGKCKVIRWRRGVEVEEEKKIGGQGRILTFDERP